MVYTHVRSKWLNSLITCKMKKADSKLRKNKSIVLYENATSSKWTILINFPKTDIKWMHIVKILWIQRLQIVSDRAERAISYLLNCASSAIWNKKCFKTHNMALWSIPTNRMIFVNKQNDSPPTRQHANTPIEIQLRIPIYKCKFVIKFGPLIYSPKMLRENISNFTNNEHFH